MVVPDAMQALLALGKRHGKDGVPRRHPRARPPARQPDQRLQRLRRHARARRCKKAGETDERLFAVAAWRETPYFTDAERAALGAHRGRHPARRPLRPGAGRRLGRSGPALRREGARGLVLAIATSTSGTASTPPRVNPRGVEAVKREDNGGRPWGRGGRPGEPAMNSMVLLRVSVSLDASSRGRQGPRLADRRRRPRRRLRA